MDSNVSPESPVEKQPVIGLIGMGAMGRMYAKVLAEAGWQRCDRFLIYHIVLMDLDWWFATSLKSSRA